MTSKMNVLARTAVMASITALLFSACASDGPRGKRGGGPGDGMGDSNAQMTERGGGFGTVDFNALYRRTMEQKANGDCQKTLAPLQTLAH